MLCNKIPLLDDCQDAEIRRLCIVNFPIRFCEKPRLKNERKIDISLEEKLMECLNEFFHLLLSYLHKYDPTTKLEKPKQVTEQLNKYIERNNEDTGELIEYLLETYEYKNGGNHKLNVVDVWKDYQNWLLPGKKRMLKDDLYELFMEIFDIEEEGIQLGMQSKKYWKNMKFKEISV